MAVEINPCTIPVPPCTMVRVSTVGSGETVDISVESRECRVVMVGQTIIITYNTHSKKMICCIRSMGTQIRYNHAQWYLSAQLV